MESTTRIYGIERCRDCRGHVIRNDGEYVCTSCGRVVRRAEDEERFGPEPQFPSPGRLGSFVGARPDKNSHADFNGVCTIGFAKLLSENTGVDRGALNCRAMIRMLADRLALPRFVRDNAAALSEKVLADSRTCRGDGRRTTMATISAYAVLSATRDAGMDQVGSGRILQALADMGHRVPRSSLIRVGLDSRVPFRPADPKVLLRAVTATLGRNEVLLERLMREGLEPRPYFRSLLQDSLTILAAMGGVKEGRNPRTVAAGSVYIASRKSAPRAVTQRAVAESAGVSEYAVREFCALATNEMGPLNPGPS